MTQERFEMLVSKFYASASRVAAKRYGQAAAAGLEGDDAVQMAAVYALEQFRAGNFSDYTDEEFGQWFIARAKFKMRKSCDRAHSEMRDVRRCELLSEEFVASRSQRQMAQDAAARDEVEMLLSEYPEYSEMIEYWKAGHTNQEIAKVFGLSSQWAAKRIKTKLRETLKSSAQACA